MLRRLLIISLTLPLIAFPQKNKKPPQQKEVKIQKTSLSRDQEIQLGKEAAAEIERTLEMVQNSALERWLNSIGQRLAQTPQANTYPYYFKIVNEDSINAFALPGGPMYVHTGLIKAADSEGQVAGVLAHEMSHVALRHGASQMSKAQTWQTIFGVATAAAGIAGGGQCGLWCQAAQIGGGIGVNSMLSKFSRDAERDADLNGARMMAAAGYNPIEVARFFEKLEAQMGAASRPRGLEAWLSSHPAPGRRVEYVAEDIRFYPRRDYAADTGEFVRARALVASLPAPKVKPAALLQPSKRPARQNLPQGFKDLQAEGFAIAYPGNWQAGQGQQGGSVLIVPQGGAKQAQSGGVELILGAMIDYYQPKGGTAELQSSTNEFLQLLRQSDQNMRMENPQRVQMGGKPALMTRITTKTSFQQDPEQVVYLYTVAREAGLWNLALAAPPSQLRQADPIFQQMAQTVVFPD
jgi:beta-barrel assembly-enhancing protease